MTMTRQEAEAAGWDVRPTTQHGFIINSEAMKTTREQGCPRSTLQVNSCVVLSAKDAEAALLAAITAIERYESAVKLLEECDAAMRAAHHVLTYSPKTDEDFAMNDAIEQCRDVIRLLNDVMLKLEARK